MLETGGWSATTEGARKAFAAARDTLAATGVELKSRADDPDLEAVEKSIWRMRCRSPRASTHWRAAGRSTPMPHSTLANSADRHRTA